jgi:hypothetical protein
MKTMFEKLNVKMQQVSQEQNKATSTKYGGSKAASKTDDKAKK